MDVRENKLYVAYVQKQLADNAENVPAPPVAASTPKMTRKSRAKKRKTTTFLPNGNIVGTTEETELSDYDISEFEQL